MIANRDVMKQLLRSENLACEILSDLTYRREIRAIPVSTDVARDIKYASGNIFRGKRLSSLRFTEERTREHEIIVAYPVNISLRVYGSISYK